MSGDFYFVSFGREPGGYLDVLKLPPNTNAAKVADTDRTYRREIEQSFREIRKTLKEEEKSGVLTPEESCAAVKKAEDEKSEKLRKLNGLKETYSRGQAQRRGLAGSGKTLPEEGWRRVYGLSSPQSPWEELLQRRLLERCAADSLLCVRRKWLDFSGADGGAFPDLASSRYRPGQLIDLAAIGGLVAERDLLHLMAADLLWLQLSLTNRSHWRDQITRWTTEIEALGPTLRLEASAKPGGADSWEYPRLCQQPSGMIEKLEAGKIPDFAQGPQRPSHRTEVADLRKFLETLTGSAGPESGAPSPGGGPGGATMDAKALLDLLLGESGPETPQGDVASDQGRMSPENSGTAEPKEETKRKRRKK